jgi:hypothetical protein
MADNKDIAGAAEQNAGTPPGISDPLSNRETDTGNLDKLDDTRTRKTIKLRPMTGVAPAVKYSEVAAAPADGEAVADPLTQRHTNTGSFAKLDDTRTRKTIKMSPAGGMKPEADDSDADAKTIELQPIKSAPATPAVPAPPPAEVETATVAVNKVSPDKGGLPNLVSEGDGIPVVPGPSRVVAPAPITSPKPSIGLKPAAAPIVPTASGPMEPDDTRTRKTIKIAASKPSVMDAAESVMPTVAQAKTIPAGETIRLRPSEGGSPAPQLAPQSSAKDTIRLKPGGSGATISPPTAAPAASVAPPSASTVALKPAPAPAAPPKPAAPSAPLVPPATGGGSKIGIKPPQSPPPGPPAASKAPSSAGGEKKGGLSLKKNEDDGTPKGPPRAQMEQEILQDKKTRKKLNSGGPSPFYTVASIFTFAFLLFSTYVTAANYVNTWEQSRFEEPIHFPIPVLEDRINLR